MLCQTGVHGQHADRLWGVSPHPKVEPEVVTSASACPASPHSERGAALRQLWGRRAAARGRSGEAGGDRGATDRAAPCASRAATSRSARPQTPPPSQAPPAPRPACPRGQLRGRTPSRSRLAPPSLVPPPAAAPRQAAPPPLAHRPSTQLHAPRSFPPLACPDRASAAAPAAPPLAVLQSVPSPTPGSLCAGPPGGER